MKHLLPLLACLLLPACSLFEEAPPVHADPQCYHYEPISEKKEESLRRALADYAAIRLHRVWYHAAISENDDGADERSLTLPRSEQTDKLLAPHLAARRWYEELWNEGCVVMPNRASISTITFLDAAGQKMHVLESTDPCCRRGEDGKAIDIVESFESFFPEEPQR